MPAVVTFAQLPDEEPAFLAYLQKSGEISARAVNDDPHRPKYNPLAVCDFLERYAAQIVAYDNVDVYLGSRNDIRCPAVTTQEIIEGGTEVPFVQFGEVVEGVHTIVGGKKVLRDFVNHMGSPFVRYSRGQFLSENHLAHSNLCYYSGTYEGQIWRPNPPAFMKWGKKVLDWMRRHTPEMVPVFECNYSIRATRGVAVDSKNGLKVN